MTTTESVKGLLTSRGKLIDSHFMDGIGRAQASLARATVIETMGAFSFPCVVVSSNLGGRLAMDFNIGDLKGLHHVPPNGTVVLPANVTGEAHTSQSPIRLQTLSIPQPYVDQYIDECWDEIKPNYDCHSKIHTDSLFTQLLVKLWTGLFQGPSFPGVFVDSAIDTLIGMLFYGSPRTHSYETSLSPRFSASEQHKIIEYINDHLSSAISIAEMAEILGMSKHRFHQAFKATFYTSPRQYLISERTKAAQALITGTKLSIAEIAYRCGFSHQSHFGMHFKRFAGMSPTAYRNS